MGNWGLIPSRGRDLFLFATAFRPALGPTQPSIQWLRGLSLPRGKVARA